VRLIVRFVVATDGLLSLPRRPGRKNYERVASLLIANENELRRYPKAIQVVP